MELIIKPTEKCNFACTFCSSPKLSETSKSFLPLEKIFQFLNRFPNTSTLIVNGGDPLMMPPKYYWDIIEFLDEKNLKTTISFTSNLWGFYKSPKTWEELFRHPRMGITTSFNYGQSRRVTDKQVYTEDLFWQVSDLFLDRIGYRPDFISVISEENADTAIKNVELAKKMDVECKLNYALASGRQSKPFVKAKIYKIYLDIIDQGLAPWEYNAKQILAKQKSLWTTCPLNRTCDSNIRCLQPDGDYYSCGAFGDDKEYSLSFDEEMSSPTVLTPLSDKLELVSLKSDCFTCPLFSICNGCKKTIKDLKTHDLVEAHCSGMQKLMPRFKEHLFGLDQSFN